MLANLLGAKYVDTNKVNTQLDRHRDRYYSYKKKRSAICGHGLSSRPCITCVQLALLYNDSVCESTLLVV